MLIMGRNEIALMQEKTIFTNQSYKLTVIVPLYNKARYVIEALDSILKQNTNYPYRIIVADDGSTDGSVEIVEDYQKRYSNINLLKSKKNHGLYRNIIRAYKICKTDYFCVLDPDDYWIDDFKIQKALDFLEKNRKYTIYVTNTLILKDGKLSKLNQNVERDSNFNDYLKGTAVWGCTLGTVYRNVVFKKGLPTKMLKLPDKSFERTFRGDSFRNFLHIRKGLAHAVSDYDGVYRVTKEGLWQGSTQLEREFLNALFFINVYKYSNQKYPELLLRAQTFLARAKDLHASKVS